MFLPTCGNLSVDDSFPKGHQRNRNQFKVLVGERDADDGDRQQDAEKEVDERNIESPAKQPEQVEENGEAPGRGGSVDHLPSKGPDDQTREFKTLNAEGNTDEGAAKDDAPGHITDGGGESPEKKPDQVSE